MKANLATVEARRVERIQRAVGAGSVDGSIEADVNALMSEHHEAIYRLCLRITGSAERSRELAQDTLLTAWVRLADYRPTGSFRSWLLAIARNLSLNAVRKHGEALAEDGVVDGVWEASPLAGLRRKEREALLAEAAAAVLSPVEQEVVHLRYVEQMPVERIGEVLELSEASGARGVLQRCRRKLRRELRRRLDELGHGSSFFARSM